MGAVTSYFTNACITEPQHPPVIAMNQHPVRAILPQADWLLAAEQRWVPFQSQNVLCPPAMVVLTSLAHTYGHKIVTMQIKKRGNAAFFLHHARHSATHLLGRLFFGNFRHHGPSC